jgi:hypothetical protein
LSQRAHLKPNHGAGADATLLDNEIAELPGKNARMPVVIVRDERINALSPSRNNG